MVKKILFLSTFLLFILIPNLEVNALQVGSLRGLIITQEEDGTTRDYNLINDYFNYTENSTRYIFSNNYKLGMNLLGDDGRGYTEFTPKLSFYFTNPCQSNENINYSQKIAFFLRDGDSFPLNTINVVNNVDGCSGYWTNEGTTFYYNQTCSLNAGSFVLGSLYFTKPYIPYGSYSNYRIGVQSDFDVRCEVNNNAIIENNNANTQNIINNNTNNTNQIIQDNQQNTQDIIDNQNSNTEKEIESQQVCLNYDKNSINVDNKVLLDNGNELNNSTFGITDYIKINSNDKIEIILADTNTGASCWYNINKEKISCFLNSSLSNNTILTIPPNSSFIRLSINKNKNAPQFSICRNGNQALTDSITSDEAPDTENEISDLESDLISDTPITDLITLPISLLNSYISGFSSTCSPYNLGNLLGTDLILPCLNLQQRLGSNLWSTIDALFSIFMIYNIAMLMIQAFEGFTSLRDDYEGLYQPRHADTGYQPKHGGVN